MTAMDMEVAARAYSSAVSGVKPWQHQIAVAIRSDKARLYEEQNALKTVVPATYNPVVEMAGNEFWCRLPKGSKEWMSAILSTRYEQDRFNKMAENCLISMTGANAIQAMWTVRRVRQEVLEFTPEERAAIRLRWADALKLDRFMPSRKGRVGRWK